MTNYTIIWNPTSGSGQRGPVEQLAKMLKARGCAAVIRETTGPGHATQLAETAAAEGATVVVAAGGDGTVREVAAGLLDTDVPLALCPVGTANSLARELNMPPRLSPEELAGIIAMGQTMPIYPGVVTLEDRGETRQEIFLESAGGGLDSRAVDAVTPALKRRLGPLAYVLTALARFIKDPHERLCIEAPGLAEPVTATWAIAVRTDHYGGWFHLGTGLTADEPRLVILYIDARGRFEYIRCVIGLLMGRMARVKCVNSIDVSGEARLAAEPGNASDSSVPLQLDGDIIARTPVTIGVIAKPIEVIVPAPITG